FCFFCFLPPPRAAAILAPPAPPAPSAPSALSALSAQCVAHTWCRAAAKHALTKGLSRAAAEARADSTAVSLRTTSAAGADVVAVTACACRLHWM
ncbi:hypothetical protein B484DRAFT_454804, partial [Ochromonadaceae sp. CCMP2298]